MSSKSAARNSDENVLPPVEEVYANPDDWARIGPKEFRENEHLDLEKLTAEFLAKGGTITQVEAGVRAEQVDAKFNRDFMGYGANEKFSHAEYVQHVQEVTKRQSAAREERDKQLAKRVGELLPLKLTKGEMLTHTGCSEGVLQRVLDTYFKDEPAAQTYRKITWAERDQQVVETYKALRQQHGNFTEVAEVMRVRPERLRKILTKHGVRV